MIQFEGSSLRVTVPVRIQLIVQALYYSFGTAGSIATTRFLDTPSGATVSWCYRNGVTYAIHADAYRIFGRRGYT